MSNREYYVLNAVSIASGRYRRRGHGFEASAAQITQVFNTDERIGAPYTLTTLEIGATMRALAAGMPVRRAPLVERVDTRRWRLTRSGVEVLSA